MRMTDHKERQANLKRRKEKQKKFGFTKNKKEGN